MNLRSVLVALALTTASHTAWPDPLPPVGLRSFAAIVPERGGTIAVDLWYPAAAGSISTLVGDNKVFQGVAVERDAPIAAGRRPLILLAHGGMRAAPNLAGWLAAGLAAQGYVVAVPRQPDPRRLTAAEAPRELWLRPADLSAALTALVKEAFLADRLDPDKVGIVGFFLGGTSALAMAGARLDPEGYARSCDEAGTGVDCPWYAKAGVDLRRVDAALLGRSNRDRRVGVAVAVDPELATSFTAASLAGISIPVRLIDLGSPGAIPPGLSAASLAHAIPAARYDAVPEATQFDAFSACKPQGAAILRSAGDEPLCPDRGNPSRAEIHARLLAMIEAALREGFEGGM
jgi:predicted dienelactone hydrolase